jgi:SAM-dependent methyltransferase
MDEKRARWNKRYAAKELIWSAGPNALLASELEGMTPGTALDAACGEGRNGLWLAEQGWQVTAVDFSEVAIGKGRQIAERRGLSLNWRVADVAQDPFPDGQYDLVVVLFLHTDPEERARWLPRLVRAVAPGGTFFYLGHDPANIEQGVGGPHDAELLPSVEEVSEALGGFELLRAEIFERSVAADPGHRRQLSADTDGTALDTFVRAVAPG